MPIAPRFAYFDHAAVGPLSGPAAAAIARFANEASQLGDTVWPTWNDTLGTVRKSAAELLDADETEIAIVPNTTTGINWVAEGFPWQSGDSVVLPEGEFPSNLFPWLNQQSRGVEVRIVPRRESGVVEIDDLLDAADGSTRIIACSWVGYASGFRLDVAQLVERAHRKGILVFLDAIQGLGIYPLSIRQTPVDFLAADGHKWLLGPEGVGVAMIRREHLDRLRIGNVGWGSVKNSFNYHTPQFDLRDEASRYEAGSANMVGAAALAESLQMFLGVRRRWGVDAIAHRVLDQTELLVDRLEQAGATVAQRPARKHQSGIVTFTVDGFDPAEIRSAGLQRDVVTSCRAGAVRAATHVYNTADDIERLVDALPQS